MKILPCTNDAWDEAKKRTTRKVKSGGASSKKRGYLSAKVHKNLNAR